MQGYKADFIEFMLASGVLAFGDFITKSGRATPFFINSGSYDSGARLERLGGFYAAALMERLAGQFDLLFGPAYKGIPLVTAAAIALRREHGVDVPIAFNRKEAKDHGEGGSLVGRKPRPGDRVVIIEDVTTAGTSVRETAALLAPLGVKLTGLAVSVDRQERGTGPQSALDELRQSFGLQAFAIVTLDDIVAHLHNRPLGGQVVLDDAMLAKIQAYRAQYGAAPAAV